MIRKQTRLALLFITVWGISSEAFGLPFVQISAPFQTGTNGVGNVTVSPDGSFVVFRNDPTTNGMNELFVLPAGYPATSVSAIPFQLHSSIATNKNRDVNGDFFFTPDSSRIIFRGDINNSNGEIDLYDEMADGSGTQTPILIAPSNNVEVTDIRLNPNGSTYTIRTDISTGNGNHVFVDYDISTGVSTQRNDPGAANENVSQYFALGSDGRIAFAGDFNSVGRRDLYTLAAGSTSATNPTQIDPSGNANADITTVLLTSDNETIVYRLNRRNGNGNSSSDRRTELYSISFAGGSEVRIMETGNDNRDVGTNIAIAPDNLTVVAIGDLDTDTENGLYKATIGSANSDVRLSEDLDASRDVSGFRLAGGTSIDPGFAVYRHDVDSDGSFSLFSVNLAGPISRTRLTPVSVNVDGDFEVLDDSVYFIGDIDLTNGADNRELYRTDLAGTSPEEIANFAGLDIFDFDINDSGHIVVLALNEDGEAVAFALAPEPSTLALSTLGLLLLGFVCWRRRAC